MLAVSRDPIITPRLALRRTRLEDAAAMFEALRDPAMYAYLPRNAPRDIAEVEARLARVMQETAPDRDDQWLNWTVWLREPAQALGMVEATVRSDLSVTIGYQFDPRIWQRGYGREAVSAMLDHLETHGAHTFEATIDIRNAASRALAKSLGFKHARTEGLDETWLRAQ